LRLREAVCDGLDRAAAITVTVNDTRRDSRVGDGAEPVA